MDYQAILQSEFVAYHPPKTVSHGHGAKARNAKKAWVATQEFLSKHTNAILSPILKVTVWGSSEWTDTAVCEQTIAEGTVAFGCPPKVSGMFNVWELPNSCLSEALAFAFKDDERPKQQLGPVSLSIWYSFEWKTLPPVPRGAESTVNRLHLIGIWFVRVEQKSAHCGTTCTC